MRKRRKGGGNLPPGSHRNWWENGPGRKGHQAMARHGAGRWRTLGGLAGMTWMKDSWASVSSQIHSLIPLLQAALPGGPPSIFHPPTHRSWVISPPSQASGCEAPPGAAFPPLPMTAKSFPGSHSCFSSCRSASPTLGGCGLGSQIQPCCWSSSLEAADLSLALRLVGPSLWSYPRVFPRVFSWELTTSEAGIAHPDKVCCLSCLTRELQFLRTQHRKESWLLRARSGVGSSESLEGYDG